MTATRTLARGVTAVFVAATIAGCTVRSTGAANPDLGREGSEAGVAVTVPSGAEILPTWHRGPDRATLSVPADLLFATDSAVLGPAAAAVLGQVLDEARARPGSTARVLVEGHADGAGDPVHNQELSERRAATVGEWLSVGGLDPATVTTRGWGETRPAVEETDEATRAANRRVVVTVTFSAPASPDAAASPEHARRVR